MVALDLNNVSVPCCLSYLISYLSNAADICLINGHNLSCFGFGKSILSTKGLNNFKLVYGNALSNGHWAGNLEKTYNGGTVSVKPLWPSLLKHSAKGDDNLN